MPDSEPLSGRIISHYRVLEQIGAGGMGVVYRAHDERLDRYVALKVLPAGALADKEARKRFRREALTLSKLTNANIAMVFDFDTQDGIDFLVMEFVAGTTLAERLAKGALAEREILTLCSHFRMRTNKECYTATSNRETSWSHPRARSKCLTLG